MKLHHLALGARDVEGVAEFYRTVFELEELARHHYPDGSLRSIWLELGPGVLMIEACQEEHHVESIGKGLFLIAFEIAQVRREPLEARLAEAGATIEERTAHTSYARDPEGNRVAISHYPSDKLNAPPGRDDR